MNYVSKPDGHNHNISHEAPLREFVIMAVIFTVVIVTLFAGTSLVADLIVKNLTPTQEKILVSHFAALIVPPDRHNGPATEYLQSLVNRLRHHAPDDPYDYVVLISCDQTPNAYALPGGIIAVTSGMQAALTNENSLAFILGHEMGHFRHRDHLRSVSRQLLFALIGTSLGITKSDSLLPMMVDLSFSREQEQSADAYAADLVRAEYGHLNGSADFFEYMLKEHPALALLPGFVSSHPVTSNRLSDLRRLAQADQLHAPVVLRVQDSWRDECRTKI